jgi:hypothetical protein
MQHVHGLPLPGIMTRLAFLLCSMSGFLMKVLAGVMAGVGVVLLYLSVDLVLIVLGGAAKMYYRTQSYLRQE